MERNSVLKEQVLSLEAERDSVRAQAQELVEKVKIEEQGRDYMVDRRMINGFLV
jgi:uncharacterized coiled-coil DUF342 family protein